MLELPHALVSHAIASKFRQPKIYLPLSLASHFVLDFIPHWDPNIDYFSSLTFILLASDLFLAFFVSAWLSVQRRSAKYLVCGFIATLPDTIAIPEFFFHAPNITHFLLGWQLPFHHNTSIIWLGLSTQLLVSLTSLMIIKNSKIKI